MEFTSGYSSDVAVLKNVLNACDALIIGAGAGLSTSAGFVYSGKRFDDNFADFRDKYGFNDMYSGGFYPYDSLEEHWAYWARYVYLNRYNPPPKQTYDKLKKVAEVKDYFVITTNVDHCFQRAGFDKDRLFYTQGDYGLFQCSKPCHDKTYDNEDIIKAMINSEKNLRVPSFLVPRCPKCGRPMSMNLRSDNTFVQDKGWYKACDNYSRFCDTHKKGKVVYLELGVGGNTPGIIKYPFWQFVAANKNATYVCINLGEAFCPDVISSRSICIDRDIDAVLDELL
jgi:NAD-dependent SIR2 family protein deacetylase